MSKLLDQAIAEANKLPESDQDALGAWLLEELASDRRWQASFDRTADKLARLAREALQEDERGETLPLDPERL